VNSIRSSKGNQVRKLIVRLKGGLGNQMFQYATARALALKNGMQLKLDKVSGFARDKVYRRTFSLSPFSLEVDFANFYQQLPFWYEQARKKFLPVIPNAVTQRPWGLYIQETHFNYMKEIAENHFHENIFMDGFWQSEKYFAAYRGLLSKELAPPVPQSDLFLTVAKKIEGCNSVAVGVRLFEEVPSASQHFVGGLVPYSFYEKAAIRIAEKIKDPSFFVFCTKEDSVRGKFSLPGKVHYLTHDNGYEGEMKSLWLVSKCANHILSNSSFYWWGAWLSEFNHTNSVIIACDQFTNSDCLPTRWLKIQKSMSV